MEIKTVEDLKKAFPALCEQLVKDAVAQKETEVKETMKKEFEAKITEATDAKSEEIKAAVIEEIKKSEEYQGLMGTLIEVGKLVAPYISEAGDDDAPDAKVEQKLNALHGEIETVKAENKTLKEQIENDKKAADMKAKVTKRIGELTAGKEHETLLVERLSSCKTLEEVETRFKDEEAFIKKLVPEKKAREKTAGGGRSLNEDKQDENVRQEAEKKRQRSLAGIEEKPASA